MIVNTLMVISVFPCIFFLRPHDQHVQWKNIFKCSGDLINFVYTHSRRRCAVFKKRRDSKSHEDLRVAWRRDPSYAASNNLPTRLFGHGMRPARVSHVAAGQRSHFRVLKLLYKGHIWGCIPVIHMMPWEHAGNRNVVCERILRRTATLRRGAVSTLINQALEFRIINPSRNWSNVNCPDGMYAGGLECMEWNCCSIGLYCASIEYSRPKNKTCFVGEMQSCSVRLSLQRTTRTRKSETGPYLALPTFYRNANRFGSLL